jgi:site-specific recombinase XerD
MTTATVAVGSYRSQRLTLPSGERTCTVLGTDHLMVEPAEEYLEYLRAQRASPNTVKSYARALALWWQYLDAFDRRWDAVTLEEFGAFLTWLRTGCAPGTNLGLSRSSAGRRGFPSRRSRRGWQR